MTDDRIRDMYKDDDPKELERLYCKVDAEVEKSKGRRVILLFVGFFLAYFLFFCIVFKPDSFGAIASFLLVDLFASPLHTWIHLLVFQWFIHKQQQENDRRELIQKRIQFAKERQQQEAQNIRKRLYRLSDKQLGILISKEIWEHSLRFSQKTNYGRNAFDLTSVWSAFLCSLWWIFDDYDENNDGEDGSLTVLVGTSFSRTYLAEHIISSLYSVDVKSLFDHQLTTYKAFISSKCYYSSHTTAHDMLKLLRDLSTCPPEERINIVATDEMELFAQETHSLRSAVLTLTKLQKSQ